jgi:hypothetical protein
MRLRYRLYDAKGALVADRTDHQNVALQDIAEFVTQHGTDPEAAGKGAMPGKVEFMPVRDRIFLRLLVPVGLSGVVIGPVDRFYVQNGVAWVVGLDDEQTPIPVAEVNRSGSWTLYGGLLTSKIWLNEAWRRGIHLTGLSQDEAAVAVFPCLDTITEDDHLAEG